jgi:hypothetical protein
LAALSCNLAGCSCSNINTGMDWRSALSTSHNVYYVKYKIREA